MQESPSAAAQRILASEGWEREGEGGGLGCSEDENLETGKWTRLKYFIGPSASHPSAIERKSIMV